MDVGLRPLARSRDLIVEELGDELLVYDMEADRGHCLSPTAARVWRRCDGRTPAEGLRSQLDLDPGAVDRAIDELAECELLELAPELTLVAAGNGSTRREVAKRVVKAGAAAAAAPLIVSVAAPTPAQAQTLAMCRTFGNCGGCQQAGCCCCTPSDGGFDCVPDFATCCALHPGGNGAAGCNPGGQCPDAPGATESTEFESQSQEPAVTEPAPTEPAPTEPAPAPEAPAPTPETPTTPTTEAPATGTTTTPSTEAAPTP